MQKGGRMVTAGTGMPSTNEPIEDQTGVDVVVHGGLPADGQELGAAADTGDTARVEEAQAAREAAAAALRDKETRKRADLEAGGSTCTPEDIAAHQEKLSVIQERRAAKEEKIDADKRELAEKIEGGSDLRSSRPDQNDRAVPQRNQQGASDHAARDGQGNQATLQG
jgi:hypothetical protein